MFTMKTQRMIYGPSGRGEMIKRGWIEVEDPTVGEQLICQKCKLFYDWEDID